MTIADDHHQFERLARDLAPNDPAEIHGLLCGLVCIDNTLEEATRLGHAASTVVATSSPQAKQSLLELLGLARRQLNDENLGFFPLLPDDETAPLNQRTTALGVWCQGFLVGLGLAGLDRYEPLSADLQECLKDLVEISKVDLESDETSDETAEQAYTEVVEYLRTNVMIIHQTLATAADTTPAASPHQP